MYSLFHAATDGSSSGKEFAILFMENGDSSVDPSLQLIITADDSSAAYSVTVAFKLGLASIREYAQPGAALVMDIPAAAMMAGFGISKQGKITMSSVDGFLSNREMSWSCH